MPAIITTLGKIRSLELLTTDMSHIGFGRPTWPDQLNPISENPESTALDDIIGYSAITTKGWLTQDAAGPIFSDGIRYSVSLTPTTIAYIQASIPEGIAEGVSNGIGQIGVFGKDVVTSTPSMVNPNWFSVSDVLSEGTLFRIQHLPIYIRPPNTTSIFTVIFPLLA